MDRNKIMLIGAMMGDLAGSTFSHEKCSSGNTNLFNKSSHLTNSSIYMLVTAERIIKDTTHVQAVKSWNIKYPDKSICGHGMNNGWIISGVLPCIMKEGGQDKVVLNARLTAQVLDAGLDDTRAAEIAAEALYMAANGVHKEEIRRRFEETPGFNLGQTIADICRKYRENQLERDSCVNVCQHALISFLKGDDYLSCIRNAVMTGGDVSSIATMTGALAAVYYGLPLSVRWKAKRLLPDMKKYNFLK